MANGSPNDKTFIEVYKCDVNFDFLSNTRPYLSDGHINSNIGRRIDTSVKKCKEIGLNPKEPVLEHYRLHLQKCLESYLKKYSHLHKHPHFNVYENINYQVYEPSDGYYEWHFENFNCGRVLVFMTYLTNTPNAGTEFVYQNYKSECVKGTTLLWPAYWTHTHRGIISKTHNKEILTGWFTSPERHPNTMNRT